MRKSILFMLSACCFSSLSALSADRAELLSSKVILEDNNGYFVLSDGSCWKTVGFSSRWRSFSEWWNNVQLVPENFNCSPNEWSLGSRVSIFERGHNFDVNEANAANREDLRLCTHVLVNNRSQVLFATPLHPAECMTQVHTASYKGGYKAGYNAAILEGNSESDRTYVEGYNSGYQAGYREGFKEASSNNQQP